MITISTKTPEELVAEDNSRIVLGEHDAKDLEYYRGKCVIVPPRLTDARFCMSRANKEVCLGIASSSATKTDFILSVLDVAFMDKRLKRLLKVGEFAEKKV